MIRPEITWFKITESNRTNQSLDLVFRISTQVGVAQARGKAQQVAWRPFRPAIGFFLSFEQSGPRKCGKWRLGRIMTYPNRAVHEPWSDHMRMRGQCFSETRSNRPQFFRNGFELFEICHWQWQISKYQSQISQISKPFLEKKAIRTGLTPACNHDYPHEASVKAVAVSGSGDTRE